MTKENKNITAGPAIHPSWAMAQAKERTPDPITAVMMLALAVQIVPIQKVRLPCNILITLSLTAYIHSRSWLRTRRGEFISVPVLLRRPSSS